MYLSLRSGFVLAASSVVPDWWIAAEIVVLLEGSFSIKELWSSDRVTAWMAGQHQEVLVVPNFCHLQNDGGHCAH